jgi:DNA-binding NarL/FixJ family response regulator
MHTLSVHRGVYFFVTESKMEAWMMKKIVLFDWQTSYQKGLKAILKLLKIEYDILILPAIHYSYISSLDEKEIALILMDIGYIKEQELQKEMDLLSHKNIPIAIITMNPKTVDPLFITKYDNVRGILSKRMETREFILALEKILKGQRYIHIDFGEVMFNHLCKSNTNK